MYFRGLHVLSTVNMKGQIGKKPDCIANCRIKNTAQYTIQTIDF